MRLPGKVLCIVGLRRCRNKAKLVLTLTRPRSSAVSAFSRVRPRLTPFPQTVQIFFFIICAQRSHSLQFYTLFFIPFVIACLCNIQTDAALPSSPQTLPSTRPSAWCKPHDTHQTPFASACRKLHCSISCPRIHAAYHRRTPLADLALLSSRRGARLCAAAVNTTYLHSSLPAQPLQPVHQKRLLCDSDFNSGLPKLQCYSH